MKRSKRSGYRVAIEWPGWHREISTPARTRRLYKWIGLAFCLLLVPVYGICPWTYPLVPVHVIAAILTARSWLLDTHLRTYGFLVRAPKWAGLSIGLLIVIASAATFVKGVAYVHPSFEFRLIGGVLCLDRPSFLGLVGYPPGFQTLDFMITHRLSTTRIPPVLGRPAVHPDGVELPLALPLLLIAMMTAFLFWRDNRHIAPGHCLKCGYDLTANESGICPECGTPCRVQGET